MKPAKQCKGASSPAMKQCKTPAKKSAPKPMPFMCGGPVKGKGKK